MHHTLQDLKRDQRHLFSVLGGGVSGFGCDGLALLWAHFFGLPRLPGAATCDQRTEGCCKASAQCPSSPSMSLRGWRAAGPCTKTTRFADLHPRDPLNPKSQGCCPTPRPECNCQEDEEEECRQQAGFAFWGSTGMWRGKVSSIVLSPHPPPPQPTPPPVGGLNRVYLEAGTRVFL